MDQPDRLAGPLAGVSEFLLVDAKKGTSWRDEALLRNTTGSHPERDVLDSWGEMGETQSRREPHVPCSEIMYCSDSC